MGPMLRVAAAISIILPILINAGPTSRGSAPPDSNPGMKGLASLDPLKLQFQTLQIQERQQNGNIFSQFFYGIIPTVFGVASGRYGIGDLISEFRNLAHSFLETFNAANMADNVPIIGGLLKDFLEGLGLNIKNVPLFGQVISTALAGPAAFGLHVDDDDDSGVAVRHINIEERASPGILGLIQSFQGLLQTIVGILEGNASVSDLANSMQSVFTSLQSVLDIRGMVTKVPVVGAYLTPAMDAVSTILGDSGMLGGLMSQVISGPDYPLDPLGNVPVQKPKLHLPISANILGWL